MIRFAGGRPRALRLLAPLQSHVTCISQMRKLRQRAAPRVRWPLKGAGVRGHAPLQAWHPAHDFSLRGFVTRRMTARRPLALAPELASGCGNAPVDCNAGQTCSR